MTCVPRNENGVIVIKNTIPSAWGGRKYHIGILRDHSLLLQQKHVHVGDQAVFEMKPVLYFAITRHVESQEYVRIGEVTTSQAMFDLSKYPTGMNVYLTKKSGGGRYQFTASSKMNI